MNYSRVFFMLLALVVFGNLSVMPQDSQESNKNDAKIFEEFESPFRYVIFRNEVETWSNGKTIYEICDVDEEGHRVIDVLMEEKSFTKENLILLFRLISSRFPKPETMTIFVHTDLRDIATPEEGEQGVFSHPPKQKLDTTPTTIYGFRATLRRGECSSKLKCKGIMWMSEKNYAYKVSYRGDVVIEYIDIVEDWWQKRNN